MSQTGALTQLIAVGAQDQNFLSNATKDSIFIEPPAVINNFAKQSHTLIPPGKVGWGSKFKMKIDKKGDLLHNLYLQFTLPEINRNNLFNKENIKDNSGHDTLSWNRMIEFYLVKKIRLYIGGELIDERVGFNMLKEQGMTWTQELFGDIINTDFGFNSRPINIKETSKMLKLEFWFSNKLDKALPLIALQHQDVELEIELNDFDKAYLTFYENADSFGPLQCPHAWAEFINRDKTSHPYRELKDIKIIASYIYLAPEERKRIAQSEHKILIKQHQNKECFLGPGPNHTTRSIDLDFNHPVSEIMFYFNNTEANKWEPNNFYANAGISSIDISNNIIETEKSLDNYYEMIGRQRILGEARILVNGRPFIDWQDSRFYNDLQISNKNIPPVTFNTTSHYFFSKEHNNYHYPTGSLNFSRIDNASLQIRTNERSYNWIKKFTSNKDLYKYDDEHIKIFIEATNWNYLIIKNGIGALAYTN